MPVYATNLDVVSLCADSSFTFLVVLNDVISRFERVIVFVKNNKHVCVKKIKNICKCHYSNFSNNWEKVLEQ